MNYFRNIYVMRTNYHFGLSAIPFEGHVSSTGIYLSWNNFERSFADYSDGNNLGLHEMAHALAYINFTARVGEDSHFKRRFKEFSKTGRKLFNEMQAGKMNMLGSYAATNYHEFWAVCIENFFERSELLKKELPGLYFEMVMLLRQDPTSDNLLISKA
jgi:MtfA peptidase